MVTIDVVRGAKNTTNCSSRDDFCVLDTNELKSCYEDAVKSVLCGSFK